MRKRKRENKVWLMKLKNISELMTDIKNEYDDDPLHWRILRGKDCHNLTTTFIAHDDKKLWQLNTELKNPMTPIGVGACVKRNLNDEIHQLLNTGTDLPIQEIYPNKTNFVVALGLGKYSQSSTELLKDILRQDNSHYSKKIEKEFNSELQKILKKEQLFNHYL